MTAQTAQEAASRCTLADVAEAGATAAPGKGQPHDDFAMKPDTTITSPFTRSIGSRRRASPWSPPLLWPCSSECGSLSRRRRPSEECLQAGLRASEDQRVHVMRALVGVDRLQIRQVAHDLILDLDAVAAVHVAGKARDLEGVAAIVALHHRDHLGRRAALVH